MTNPDTGSTGRLREAMDTTNNRPSRFYGWNVVAAAFVVAVFGWGTGFYGPPVYLEIVRQSRGWPIALVSGAVTLHFLVGLALIPKLPALYRRLGLPIVTVAGGVMMTIGILGWSLARVPWQLYTAAFLSGIGWSALGAVAINAIVSPWFDARRPLALGIAFNGGSVGGVIFSPLWIVAIDRIGFPVASLIVGLAMIATLGALAAVVLTRTPESTDGSPHGGQPISLDPSGIAVAGKETSITRTDLLGDRGFLTLCIGMTLALFAQTGLIAHLVSILAPTLGKRGAGLAAGASGIAAVVGRLVVGSGVFRNLNWRAVASGSLLVQVVGCAVLILGHGSNPLLTVFGVMLFGLGVGNAISVPPVIANLEFSRADAARAVALIVAISQGAYAIAPIMFGLIRQVTSDRVVFLAAATIEFLAIVSYLSKGSVKE